MTSRNDPEALTRVNDAFFMVDGDWRFTFVNPQAAERWQRPAHELIGRVMWEEFPALTHSVFGDAYRTAAATRNELVVSSMSAESGRWYELRIYPLVDGLAAAFFDITDIRDTETELARVNETAERERRMYRTVLSNSPDYLFVFDLEARLAFANVPLLELWQQSLDQVLGRTMLDIVRPNALGELVHADVLQVIATGKPVRHQSAYTSPHGTRDYEYIFMPVFGDDGRIEAVAGSSRDITEHRLEAERLLREARRKDEFLATLAHELRNPLAPIRNALEVSRLSNGNAVTAAQAYDIMERQLGNMVRLIDDLLDLSRLNLGKVELRRQSADLAAVVANAVETARPHIETGGHSLRLNIPGDVLCVHADQTRLAQVFANLLINAAKFTPRNGHLDLTVSHDATDAIVTVRDNGVGIDAAMLERVFEMFTQAPHTVDRAQGGLGIGLTLVRGLVGLHGGSVVARSEGVGRGAEFEVCIPLAAQPHADDDRRTHDAAPRPLVRRHILIVDDNADNANSLSMMLDMMGHETATANDGLEALALAESFLPEVCLLDIGMPNLDGYELARRLRQRPWADKTLLVALTGWGQEEDKRRSAEAGIHHHLVKPVNPAALVALLERYAGEQPMHQNVRIETEMGPAPTATLSTSANDAL